MEFCDEIKFFFENHGRCPVCKCDMVLQFGCIMNTCPTVIATRETHTKKKNELKVHYRLRTKQNETYLTYIREKKLKKVVELAKNLDNAPKKTYSLINE